MIRHLVAAIGLSAVAATAVPSAQAAGDPLLAPPGTCAGQATPAAPKAVQETAMRCLINYARARKGMAALRPHAWLTRKAHTKVQRVEACQEFSHTPCGVPNTLSGSRLVRFGEVIYASPTASRGTARAAMAGWLSSPPHRRALLTPSYRWVGVGVSKAATLNGRRTWIWAATLGV